MIKNLSFCSLSMLVVLMMGCANNPTRTSEREPEDNVEGLPAPTPGAVHEVSEFKANKNEDPGPANPELEGIPVEINAKVEQWVSYFQGRGRPHMERYLARSSRYAPLMKRILKQNGLPDDLIYIALIESGFSSKVASRAAAVGYWQFIRGTGRRYGLEINAMVDERRDPVLSTQAAADYFKGLYSVFGSWYLAMASYNVGENRVQREVMKHRTRDFWELAHKKRLPKETMNYVPKFMAAKLIGKNPEKYGFTNIEWEDALEFETIRVENPINLRIMAEKMGMEYDDLKQLNPKFRGEVAPTKESGVLELRVPVSKSQAGLIAAQDSIVDKVEFVADAGETETYRIKNGDSLYSVARKYRTTVAWLRDMNDMKAGRKLKIGMRIQVPDRSRTLRPSKKIQVASRKEPPKDNIQQDDQETAASNIEIVTSKGVLYIVQPGDSLYSIAEEYDSSVAELSKMNKMRKGQVLKVGMKLQVPKDEGLPQDPGETNRDQKASEPTVAPGADPKAGAGTSVRKINPAKLAKQQLKNIRQVALRRPQNIAQAPKFHVVRKGENLTQIAVKYAVPLNALLAKNRLAKANLDVVFVGKRLEIPSAGSLIR